MSSKKLSRNPLHNVLETIYLEPEIQHNSHCQQLTVDDMRCV